MPHQAEIPSSHPALPGHFPGNPIVPAAVILQLVIDAASGEFPGRRITGVKRVKFLNKLGPAQPFSVAFHAGNDAGARFRVEREGSVLAEGQLTFARDA